MDHERLIILLGLIIGAIVGVGAGAIFGDMEFFGMLGAVIGAAFGLAGIVRFNKRIDRKPSRSHPHKARTSGRRSKKKRSR